MDKIHFYDKPHLHTDIRKEKPTDTIDFDSEIRAVEQYIKHNGNFYEQRTYVQNVDNLSMEYYFIKTA